MYNAAGLVLAIESNIPFDDYALVLVWEFKVQAVWNLNFAQFSSFLIHVTQYKIESLLKLVIS